MCGIGGPENSKCGFELGLHALDLTECFISETRLYQAFATKLCCVASWQSGDSVLKSRMVFWFMWHSPTVGFEVRELKSTSCLGQYLVVNLQALTFLALEWGQLHLLNNIMVEMMGKAVSVVLIAEPSMLVE